MTFTVKRKWSDKEGCYLYGIMKDGKLHEGMILYGQKNANLVAEYLNMMEQFIIEKDSGMHQVMQILRIDKERKVNGKVERGN